MANKKVFTNESLTTFIDEIKNYVANAISGKSNTEHNHDNKYDAKGSAATVQNELDAHTTNSDIHFTVTERTKLSGIETGAQKNTITGVKGGSESTYRTGNVNITKSNIGLGNVDNTSDTNKPVSTAQQTAIDSSLNSAKSYTDTKIANLINSAPSTLDTLGEIATAMAENDSVVEALESAVGTKANASDLTSHTSNKSNPHGVTKSQVGLGNVENKSSATIRSEITKSNVTTALGYTPYTQTEVDSLFDGKVDKISGKGLSTNDYTTTEKDKLASIAEGAEVNQNAFGKVTVGSSTITADAEIDTLTMVAGTGISLTADTSADKVTITNSGVRSISTGGTNGTISVNTNGTSTNVAIKGLGSAAYTASSDYAAASHGTHVSYATIAPKMDGTASAGSASTVARTDHVHPTDTSRASQTDLDALEAVVDGKAPKTHSHAISDVTNLQSTLDGKQATITGGATTIASSNLTASRALVSNSSGKVAVSAVTSTELGYLDGVTSSIQTQLDGKVPTSRTVNGKALTGNISLSASDVGAASSSHSHSASNITSGTLPIERGGTGNIWGYIRAGAQEDSSIGALATAEGRETIASGDYSHAEGNYTEATGSSSHAEGQNTEANGNFSHAEGEGTEANGKASHAEGQSTIASGDYSHAQGKYNVEDTSGTYAHIVGNGTGTSARSNAHTVDWSGNGWFAGDVYIGGTGQSNGVKLVKSTDVIAIAKGGTGATTAAGAITNLGAMDLSSAQTVSGVKTFSNGIKLGKATMKYDSSAGAIVFTFE